MSVEVPKGWSEGRLKDLCEGVERRLGNGDKLEILSVAKRGVVPQSQTYDKEIASEDVSRYRVIEPGEFGLAPMALYYGAIGRYRGTARGIISPAYNVFRHTPNTDPDFLETLIRIPRMIARYDALSQGGNLEGKRKLTPYDAFETVQIAIPPLEEQRAIAEVLGAVEEAITKTEVLIETISGALNSTLDWVLGAAKSASAPIVNFGEVIESTKYGTSAKCDDDSTGFPVLRIPNVLSRGIDQGELKYAKLPANEAEKFALRDGDILAVRTNGNPEYVGRMALIRGLPDGIIYASYLIRIRVDPKKVLPEFVWLCSETYPLRESLTSAATTSAGNFNINSDGLRSAKIPLPNLAEQRRIVDAAETLRVRRLHELTYLDQLRKTHAALAQELLSGRIRLPESIIVRHRDKTGQAA